MWTTVYLEKIIQIIKFHIFKNKEFNESKYIFIFYK